MVKEVIGAVTGGVSHISCRNAVIAGKANLPQSTSTDLTFGVLYSTSSGVLIGTATKIQAQVFDSNYSYTITTEALEPETEYFYRSYISQNNEISYGEVRSFTTLPASSMIKTLEATDINPKDAVLKGFLDLTDCVYGQIEYGFVLTPDGGSAKVLKASNHSDNAFSIKDESLARDTKYDFAAYVNLDGREYKSETKTFTTTSVKASVTAEAKDVWYHRATISGKLTVESEGTFIKYVRLYYSSTASTLDKLVSSGTKEILTLLEDGSFSIDLSSLSSNTAYNYVIVTKVDDIEFRTDVICFKTLSTPSAVDLGLSVKWASFNLGACKPEEYGGYYQWAGTTDVTDRSIYLKYGNGPYSYSPGWTKYIPSSRSSYWSGTGDPDNKTVLVPKDDAAHVALGGNWRMPTSAEWSELLDNCTWTWTSDYNGTGVAGRIVTSNKEGYTDKSIFLPAAGIRYGGNLGNAGSYGYYWSSSLHTGDPDRAYNANFNSDYVLRQPSAERCDGLSVRPVQK